MRTDESADLFFECLFIKASKYEFFESLIIKASKYEFFECLIIKASKYAFFECLIIKASKYEFFECLISKASKYEFINDPVLNRKREHPNYKSLVNYFQVDGQWSKAASHHPVSPKEDFRVEYFEALDLWIVSIKTRFDQPSFNSLLNLESFLLQSIEGQEVDEEIIKYLSEPMVMI